MRSQHYLFVALVVVTTALVYGQDATTAATAATPPPPRVRARIAMENAARFGNLLPSDQLKNAFDTAAVSLEIEYPIKNGSSADREASIALYVNYECEMDGNEISLGDIDDATLTANAGGSVDLSELTLPSVQSFTGNPCGSLCLLAEISVEDFTTGYARAGLVRDCDPGDIDFAIQSDQNAPNNPIDVVWGTRIGENQALNAYLQGVKVAQLGGGELRTRARGLEDSVAIAWRMPFTDDEARDLASFNCTYEEEVGMADGKRRRRSIARRMKRQAQTTTPQQAGSQVPPHMTTTPQQAGSQVPPHMTTTPQQTGSQAPPHMTTTQPGGYYEEYTPSLDELYWYWSSQQDTHQMNLDSFPDCISNFFRGHDNLLSGGDFIVRPDAFNDGPVDIDLSDMVLDSAVSPCRGHQPGDIEHIQLVIIADPFALYDDADRCNNALKVDLNVECPEEVINEGPSCRLLVDAMSKGQSAALMDESYMPQIWWNADQEEILDWFCPTATYHHTIHEMLIYEKLAERLQRMADEDPEFCARVDEADADDERQRLVAAAAEAGATGRRRRKRAASQEAAPTDDELQAAMADWLDDLEGQLNTQDPYAALRIKCVLRYLNATVRALELAEDNELVGRVRAVAAAIPGLAEQFEEDWSDVTCDDVFDDSDWGEVDKLVTDEDFVMRRVEKLVDGQGPKADVFGKAFEEYSQSEGNHVDFSEDNEETRFEKFMEVFRKMNETCPGQRGSSAAGQQTYNEQVIGLTSQSGSNQFKDGVERSELPASTCGRRILNRMLENGAGRLLLRGWGGYGYFRYEIDTRAEKARMAAFMLNELKTRGDDADLEEVMAAVYEKMNAIASDEAATENCGVPTRRVIPDDVFRVHWMVQDGKVLRGTRDILSEDYGVGSGVGRDAGRRLIDWEMVATCACDRCDGAMLRDAVRDGGEEFERMMGRDMDWMDRNVTMQESSTRPSVGVSTRSQSGKRK